MISDVKAGIHPSASEIIEKEFSRTEKYIVSYWARDWWITSAGKRTTPGRSDFKFFLAKPEHHVEEALGISKEVIIILSPYKVFEPRTLEAFDTVRREFIEQRYEKLCYVLISADEDIEVNLKACLTNQEDQIIVPFTYGSFEKNKDKFSFIKNCFRHYFYSRDLFDYSEPLKTDTFFFGRSDIVTTVIEKHKAGSNYGLFGLRKTGKTSIIYDIERKSFAQDYNTIIIDCQNTSLNMRRWNKALYYTANQAYTKILGDDLSEALFDETNAAVQFGKAIELCHNSTGKTILFLFDEIENITFG